MKSLKESMKGRRMTLSIGKIKKYYYGLGIACLIGWASFSAILFIIAPFAGYEITINTNHFSEGLIELILAIVSIPAMLWVFVRTAKDWKVSL